MAETVERTLRLAPDRVAVFGYAHVPWMKKHQALLPEDGADRGRGSDGRRPRPPSGCCIEHGWRAIGLDHYALPNDELSAALDAAVAAAQFPGLHHRYRAGAARPRCLVDRIAAAGLRAERPGGAALARRVRAGELATARGIALSDDDRLRRDVIETLMCQGRVTLTRVAALHGADPAPLLAAAPGLEEMAGDGLIDFDGDTVAMRPGVRLFVRTVAAVFDAWLGPDQVRHARAV